MRALCESFLYFCIYAFTGWLYETVLCSIAERRWVNRGFLNGPLCPIYGFGALLIILCLSPLKDSPLPLLFIAGAVLTCSLEYFTSYLMEKLFHARWWDYSKRRFNLAGRICLEGALIFGVFSVLMLRIIHPPVASIVHRLATPLVYALSVGVCALILADTALTACHMLRLNGRLAEIQAAINGYTQWLEAQAAALKVQLSGQRNALLEQVEGKKGGLMGRAEALKAQIASQFENSPFHSERIAKLLSFRSYQDRRLFKAFPSLRSTRYGDAFEKLKDRALSRRKDANQ